MLSNFLKLSKQIREILNNDKIMITKKSNHILSNFIKKEIEKLNKNNDKEILKRLEIIYQNQKIRNEKDLINKLDKLEEKISEIKKSDFIFKDYSKEGNNLETISSEELNRIRNVLKEDYQFKILKKEDLEILNKLVFKSKQNQKIILQNEDLFLLKFVENKDGLDFLKEFENKISKNKREFKTFLTKELNSIPWEGIEEEFNFEIIEKNKLAELKGWMYLFKEDFDDMEEVERKNQGLSPLKLDNILKYINKRSLNKTKPFNISNNTYNFKSANSGEIDHLYYKTSKNQLIGMATTFDNTGTIDWKQNRHPALQQINRHYLKTLIIFGNKQKNLSKDIIETLNLANKELDKEIDKISPKIIMKCTTKLSKEFGDNVKFVFYQDKSSYSNKLNNTIESVLFYYLHINTHSLKMILKDNSINENEIKEYIEIIKGKTGFLNNKNILIEEEYINEKKLPNNKITYLNQNYIHCYEDIMNNIFKLFNDIKNEILIDNNISKEYLYKKINEFYLNKYDKEGYNNIPFFNKYYKIRKHSEEYENYINNLSKLIISFIFTTYKQNIIIFNLLTHYNNNLNKYKNQGFIEFFDLIFNDNDFITALKNSENKDNIIENNLSEIEKLKKELKLLKNNTELPNP